MFVLITIYNTYTVVYTFLHTYVTVIQFYKLNFHIFFSLPKNEIERQKWCSTIGREKTKKSFVL